MAIVKGHFRADEATMPLWSEYQRLLVDASAHLNVVGRRLSTEVVLKVEEKGSDVNLASHLLHDAHLSRFEKALVISNDSDLACAIGLVRDEVGLPVVVCNPGAERDASAHLANVSSEQRQLRVATLRACQFANPIVDPATGGGIHRPGRW